MLIDWFTVAAQAVNFLILVWLMKRFLYKPILNAIDAREKKIAATVADASKQKADAEGEKDEFKKKNADFDTQRSALLVKATDDAKAEGARLLVEARKVADALSVKLREASENEERDLHQSVRRRTEQEVFAVARKTLTDLAGISVEQCMGDLFARRLREMDAPSKKSLGDAIRAQGGPSTVSSAFDMPEGARAVLQKAINETFSADVHLRFETMPTLICGIELAAKGQKVAWSIADYLSALENEVKELLKKREKPKPAPAIPEPAAKKSEPEPAVKAA